MAGGHEQHGAGQSSKHGALTHVSEATKAAAKEGMNYAAHADHAPHPFRNLFVELALDFVIMFFVMYLMIAIASARYLYLNLGNVYMTLMMVAPMMAFMIFFMGKMSPSPSTNRLLVGLAALIFTVGWFGMREQVGVGDAQFLRSMIPHHSGAILMCDKAKSTDPEVVKLCDNIVATQNREITQMQAILQRIER